MVLTLELPRNLEQRLVSEALRLGVPVEEYALRLLGKPAKTGQRPANGNELVAFWQREGVIGSRPEIADSQEHARAIRQRAEQRLRG